MTPTRRTLLICLVLILIAAPSAPVRGTDPVTARLIVPPITSLDPVSLLPSDLGARDLVENLFVGLVRHDPLSNTIQPVLAREWVVSPDGLLWRFTLRDDVQWVRYHPERGQVEALRPVVAGDFIYGIRRACDPAPPNPVARMVYIIEGCRTIATTNPLLVNDIFIARELGVRVINPQTLEIRLLFPAPYLPALLAKPEFRPVPREAVSQGPTWAQSGLVISSGPWVMSGRDAASVTLIRNPFWPDAPVGNVEQVIATFAASPERIPAAFAAGEVDFARLDQDTAAALAAVMPGAALAVPGPTVTVLGFSAERNVANEEAFRRALALAINRERLVAEALPGIGLPTWRLTPPGAIGGPTEPPDNRGFAPEAASAALASTRFVNCRLGETLEFVVEDRPQAQAVAAALLAQWQETLGCSPAAFNVRVSPPQVVERVANGTFSTIRSTDPSRPHLWLYSWTPDHEDLGAWTGDGLHCHFGYMRPNTPCGEADALIDTAAVEADPARRLEAYNRAEAMWFGEAGSFPIVPLYITRRFIGRQPGLEGVTVLGPAWFDGWQLGQ